MAKSPLDRAADDIVRARHAALNCEVDAGCGMPRRERELRKMDDGWMARRIGRWCEPHMPHFGCAGDGHVMKPGRLGSAPSDVSPTVAAANQAATTSHRRNPITTQMPLFQTFLMSLTWYYSSADILRL